MYFFFSLILLLIAEICVLFVRYDLELLSACQRVNVCVFFIDYTILTCVQSACATGLKCEPIYERIYFLN